VKAETTFTANAKLSFMISDRFTVSHFHVISSVAGVVWFHQCLHSLLKYLNLNNTPLVISFSFKTRLAKALRVILLVFTAHKIVKSWVAPLCGAVSSNNFKKVVVKASS
jgi:hypothetical protein